MKVGLESLEEERVKQHKEIQRLRNELKEIKGRNQFTDIYSSIQGNTSTLTNEAQMTNLKEVDMDDIKWYKQAVRQEMAVKRLIKENIKDTNESIQKDADDLRKRNAMLIKENEKLKQENERIRRELQIEYEEGFKEEVMNNIMNERRDFQNQIELCKEQMKEIKSSESDIYKRMNREIDKLTNQLNESDQKRLKAERELQNVTAQLKTQDHFFCTYKEKIKQMEEEMRLMREKELNSKHKRTEVLDSADLIKIVDEMLNLGRARSFIPDINFTSQRGSLLKILFNKLLDKIAEYERKLNDFKEQLHGINSNKRKYNEDEINELKRRNNKLETQMEVIHKRYEYFS